MNTLTIRHTKLEDIQRLQQIFATARQFMHETGNPDQWAPDYPNIELLQQDIESGDSYVIEAMSDESADNSDSTIVATFVLRGGIDPTYNTIYEGQWLNDAPYVTIHRVASSQQVKGVFKAVMRFALEAYDNIRIDTHRDNLVMQQAISKAGFKYCGVIHCWNGTDRLAYQFTSATVLQ